MLSYDVVIATRNRPDVLGLSIPRMLAQSRAPARIIVVDASDDPGPVRVVLDALPESSVPVELFRCDPGLPLQRNAGLAQVTAPVVMFPDDDAIWFDDTAEQMMQAYERDDQSAAQGEGPAVVGAVCAAESAQAPPGMQATLQSTYRMRPSERFKQWVGYRRVALEQAVFPDPFVVHGRSRWGVCEVPGWFAKQDVVRVEWMTGFRMSFRTEVIRATGFDEALQGYALFEDTEASYSVMQKWLVVGARQARVYHHKAPARRTGGFESGLTQVLNRGYVVCKHAQPQSPARRKLHAYAWYKTLQYLAGLHTRFGRERLRGAWHGAAVLRELRRLPLDELAEGYQRLLQQAIRRAHKI